MKSVPTLAASALALILAQSAWAQTTIDCAVAGACTASESETTTTTLTADATGGLNGTAQDTLANNAGTATSDHSTETTTETTTKTKTETEDSNNTLTGAGQDQLAYDAENIDAASSSTNSQSLADADDAWNNQGAGPYQAPQGNDTESWNNQASNYGNQGEMEYSAYSSGSAPAYNAVIGGMGGWQGEGNGNGYPAGVAIQAGSNIGNQVGSGEGAANQTVTPIWTNLTGPAGPSS